MSKEIKPTEADKPHNCPHCNVSLLGTPISKENQKFYSGKFFKREIGVEISQFYDGIYFWICPDCKGEWGGYRSLK